jgi:Domain of unknown function (DUF4955)
MKKNPVTFLIILLLFCSICVTLAQKTAKIYADYEKNPLKSNLTDFSYAGYHYGEKEIPSLPIKVNVNDKGILPNTGVDLIQPIQNLINEVGQSGGGVIYFPKGKYCVNMDTTRVQFLKVDYDNVVLRGESSAVDGTIIYSGSNTIQEKMNPWISPSVIRFGYKIQPTQKFWSVAPLRPILKIIQSNSAADPGSDGSIFEAPVLTSITMNCAKGDKKLFVASTKNIKAGDVIILAMYNTTTDGNLIKDILNFTDQDITPDLLSVKAGGIEGMASFQHLLEVESVQGSNVIVLKQPLRRDIQMIYKPVIAAAPMIREVGIENMRFESAWGGIYLHHGGGKYSPHLSKIMDYGWNAVNFCRVAHGWMRNISIDNYTNPVYLQDSRNVTIENLKTTGPTGHCGIKMYAHAADNLIRNVSFESNFTHMLSAEGNAYGNVCSRISYNFKDSFPGEFDFHGFSLKTYSPPSWTLFELVKGFNCIKGGGAASDMPHTSRNNVWWNIESHGLTKETELFDHWVFAKQGKKNDHFKMFPGSIVVGYRSDNQPLVVNGTQEDRDSAELYLEGLNKGPVFPISLYEAQLKKRLKK